MATGEVRHAGGVVRVPAGRPFVIGRGPDADLDLPHPRVSRRHAVVELTPEGWTLTDRSANGTYLGEDRVTVLRLERPVVVRLGRGSGATTVELHPVAAAPPAPPPRSPPPLPSPTLPVPTGSSVRAATPPSTSSPPRASRSGGSPTTTWSSTTCSPPGATPCSNAGPTVRGSCATLGSGNGTFVDGTRTARATVTPADVIGIGRTVLRLQGDRLVAVVDSGDVSRPADQGHVRYDGRDLYAGYDELRHRIGLVRRTTCCTRSSRCAGRCGSRRACGSRTTSPLPTAKPSLLFLDEPTSGLDPGLDRSVMRTLRGLADGTDGAGRTVVVVTHSVLNLDVCDLLLVLAPGSHVPPRASGAGSPSSACCAAATSR